MAEKMRLNKIQKAKAVMSINFTVLVGMIILTPFFIKSGMGFLSESFVEGGFLAVEIIALFLMFRHYDFIMSEKEQENADLNLKLKKRERELLNAFQYLGKLNVQFSMIKDVLEKMKVPNTRGQLKEVYSELLRIVCSATGRSCAGLKIIDLNSSRTMGEFFEVFNHGWQKECRPDIGNKDLIKMFNSKDSEIKEGGTDYVVFYSNIKNFFIKAFIYVPRNAKGDFSSGETDFLEAIANQCEIFFLLFDARHHKEK